MASLTDIDLDLIGYSWAPDWMEPFFDALLAAVIDRLERADKEIFDRRQNELVHGLRALRRLRYRTMTRPLASKS
jgi:hypothetical protein